MADNEGARKSLYGKDGVSYTEEALGLDREMWGEMEKVMRKYVGMGYPLREVAHVIQGTIFDVECSIALDIKGKV